MHISKAEKIRCPFLIFSLLFLLSSFSSISFAEIDTYSSPPIEVQEQFKKAVELTKRGSYREAEDILLNIIERDDLWKGMSYFFLGSLYKRQGLFDKAEEYLKKSADSYPLLRDYALKLLTELYIAIERFDKALETAKEIQNKVLTKDTRKFEITALLGSKQEEEAIKLLYRYVKDYSNEWESELTLARLLKKRHKTDEAVNLLKDIYLNAVPLSADALRELKDMKADTFSPHELLRRADKLFEKGNFKRAEETYMEVLAQDSEPQKIIDKNKILFSIAMCQFRLREYDESAKSFNLIESSEALYMEGISYYRINDKDGFNKVIGKFESKYPEDKRLAKLLLISAEDMRRMGKLSEAEKLFKTVLNAFPQMSEEVLWGLGWMSYTSGDYASALKYFSRLTASVKGEGQDKYLYWQGRSLQKLTKNCTDNQSSSCPKENDDLFRRLSKNTSYYGYLAMSLFPSSEISDNIKISVPAKPEGEAYERIEALIFLGMKDEAANEIKSIIQEVNTSEEFLYLGFKAMDVGEYKRVIAIGEGLEKKEFLPFLYPLGYQDIIKKVAGTENVDASLVTALIREESRFDPVATSSAGAIGLMQIMPSTAQRLKDSVRIDLKNDSELYNVEKNILIGSNYLSSLIKKFKEIPFALAAYNAGETTLQKWLEQFKDKDIDEFIEDIPYRETRGYVKKVLRSYWQYRRIEGLPLGFTF